MHKHSDLLKSLGELIKSKRAITMDQTEFAARLGVSRRTVSAIENGKPVVSTSLFMALEHFGLLDDIGEVVTTLQKQIGTTKQRKQRKPPKVLSNDF